MTTTLKLNDLLLEKWEKLAEYIWTEVEKEWPHFWSDDIDDFGFYVRENCNIQVGPEDLTKPVLIDTINKYLDSHTLSLSLLPDKYKEMEKDMEVFENLGHDIFIDWFIGRGSASFEIQTDKHFKEDFKNYLDLMHKQFGFSIEKVELVAYFSGPNISDEIIKQATDYMLKEFETFDNKWKPILVKEIKFVNELLKDIVNNRLFKKDRINSLTINAVKKNKIVVLF